MKRKIRELRDSAKSSKSFDIPGRKGCTNSSYLDAEISRKGETCSSKE